jgi:LCP family protein required for cell wall assembly
VGIGWGTFLIVRLQNRIYVPLPPTSTVQAIVATPTVNPASASTHEAVASVVAAPTEDLRKSLPTGRFNILVMGTDKRPEDPDHYPRSDTMLLANIDTRSNKVGIMSIPRDLIVDIAGYGKNKVNAAYLFGEYYQEPGGGQALAVQTMSQFFNVPIDYYITVNFQGFERVVDTVGGVDIDVPYSIDDYNYPSENLADPFGEIHVHFDEGLQHMDGKTALRYARTRHADNDFARSRRQLQLIMAVRQKALSLDLLPALPNLIDDLGGMVETNIPFDQQLGLVQLGYNLSASSIVTTSIDSTMIVPATLPDGTEGLKLDPDVAGPVLDRFFGLDSSGGSGIEAGGKASSSPSAVPTTARKATPLRTPAPATR